MKAIDSPLSADFGSPITERAKTPPYVQVRKSAHDTIIAYPEKRFRASMLGMYLAFTRAQNDSRALHGEAFSVPVAEIARLSGRSVRTAQTYLLKLEKAGLLAKPASGRAARTESTYRLLSPDGPPCRALASAPASLAEVAAYALHKGWDVPAETLRVFYDHNCQHDWLIPDRTGKRFNPSRDWRRLLPRWIAIHRSLPPVPSAPSDPATPATDARVLPEPLDSANISASPSGDPQSERIQKRIRAVGALKRRQAATQWTAKERAAFKAAGLDTMADDDFAAQLAPLAAYYDESALPRLHKFWQTANPEQDFRRRDLATLLNNWPTELDRAQDFARWRKQRLEEAASNRL